VPDTPPPLPSFASWPTFPFEGDFRVRRLDDPVPTEPPRHGENPAECRACSAPDEAYIWVSERWRVRSLDRPTGLPMVLILESRSHLDLGDLPNMLAAELGVMTVRLERAIRSLDGVARVHINRWGDGSAHLHVWFLARPYGRLQLRGTFLSLWDEILPAIPDTQWRENLALVAAWLAEFGGRPLAEPPRIDWKAPTQLTSLQLPDDDGGALEGGADHSAEDGHATPNDAAGRVDGIRAAGADGGRRDAHDPGGDDPGHARTAVESRGGRGAGAANVGAPAVPGAGRSTGNGTGSVTGTMPDANTDAARSAGKAEPASRAQAGSGETAVDPNRVAPEQRTRQGATAGHATAGHASSGPRGVGQSGGAAAVADPGADSSDEAGTGAGAAEVVAAGVGPAQTPGSAGEDSRDQKGRPRRWRRR
jgi:hypothetical protein